MCVGHLQVVTLTLGVVIQCAGFCVCQCCVGGGTRSRYYTSEYHEHTYMSIVMEYVQFIYLILVLLYLVVVETSM